MYLLTICKGGDVMAIQINFDTANQPEKPLLILTKRNLEKFGVITNVTNIRVKESLGSICELSFVVHKHMNREICFLWNELQDGRFVYIEEWNKYFQITVNINESTETTKTITGQSVQEVELSQTYLYETEINTSGDIARDDYVATVLYNPTNPTASLLNRILTDKMSHYKIAHVDSTIANIQRTFSFDGVSIYDALQEIAEEINCLFTFGDYIPGSNSIRTISAYDMESYCKDCGYRGEFIDECPKCKSHDIIEGYGEDTNIFINRENLTDDIDYSTDYDNVKNCFRLEAGDDLMTATVINSTPSKSQYMWRFSPSDLNDMSDSLNEKINGYNNLYEYYEKEYSVEIDALLVEKYNALIQKYKAFNSELYPINMPLVGYQKIMEHYYNVIDLHGYLYNSLMPSVEIDNTNAKEQASFLTTKNLSPTSVQDLKYISLATANSTLLSYAKVFVNTAKYKIKIKNSSISENNWTGNFTVENYYDEEDVADSEIITVEFNDNYENFIKQKLDKILNEKKDDLSIIGLFKMSNDDFTEELRKYSLTYLQIIHDACQSCLDILIEQGISDKSKWVYSSKNLYDEIYTPYYTKKTLIDKEIKLRESEIALLNGVTDEYGDFKIIGIKNAIENVREEIIKALDFRSYIDTDWEELCSFRREDSWSNSNYISDGLDNIELYKKAAEFLERAKEEIIRASTSKHSISVNSLKNLLIIPEFQPIVKYFKTGNWLRIEVDKQVYKLRLLNYELNYDSLDDLSVEFSDVLLTNDTSHDLKTILNQSQSMTTSYSSVKRQAKQGSDTKVVVDSMVESGIDTSVVKIFSGENQDIIYDDHGLLFRKYNPDTESYSEKQLKIINSTLSITTDNWKTSKVGLGEFDYYNPKTQQMEKGFGLIANQIVGGLLLTEEIGIYNEKGTMTMDSKGLNITNGTNSFSVNPNDTSLLKIKKGDVTVFSVTDTGELTFTGNVIANDLILGSNGLHESNDVTGISISPDDVEIFTLRKGLERVLYFDENGDLHIKADVVATGLVLPPNTDIDISQNPELTKYVKKDTAIGKIPNQTTTGFIISNEGKMQAGKAVLYNSEIYSKKGNISGFIVGEEVIYSGSSINKYFGLNSKNVGDFIFAGSPKVTGEDSTYRLTNDGHVYSSNTTIKNNGFEILDELGKKSLWFSETNNLCVTDAENLPCEIVKSDEETEIKIKINKETNNLEFWVNAELYTSIPQTIPPEI